MEKKGTEGAMNFDASMATQHNEPVPSNVGANGVTANEDPGVIEVVASPETDGAFTEEMINQIISMLQSEGQITPETHTVIVHTPGGTMLRVQIQQVDGAELEQENVEEIPSTDAGLVHDVHQQDQLVYIGQPGEEYQSEQQQQFTTVNNSEHLLQNGGQQYLAIDQQQVVHEENQHHQQQHTLAQQFTNTTDAVTYPSSLMSDVADQVLHAANIIDNGYPRDTTNVAPDNIVTPRVNGIGLHTTSLNNGVILSYEEPKMSPAASQTYQTIGTTSTLDHSRMGSPVKSRIGSKINISTQYGDSSDTFNNNLSPRNNYQSKPPISNSYKSPQLNRRKPVMVTQTNGDNIVHIKIDTGRNNVEKMSPKLNDGVIRIKTTTGQIKPRSPKFFRCTSCTIHFVTEQSLLQHIKHGCVGSRKKTSYECTYCLSKFSSKNKTMDHLRVCTKRSQVKHKKNMLQGQANRNNNRKTTSQAVEVELNSDDDDEDETAYKQEKNIVYDDDDDIDIDLACDNEDYETGLTKVSQKHLGPILTGGKFQCRDCDRTFNKDSQYKRHESVCTNAPLNASRIDDSSVSQSEKKPAVEPKKRGRPKKSDAAKAAGMPGRPKVSATEVPSRDTKKISADAKVGTKRDWNFSPPPPSSKKARLSPENNKKTNNIMEMLEENLESHLGDGSKGLSESFLQCLDAIDGEDSKTASPNKSKSTVCGLCIRHMESDKALAEHITSVHGKDVVNMHAILTNNTDLKTHKCFLCNLHFVSSEGLNHHIVACHQEKLQDILKTLRANSLDVPCPWCSEKHMSTELFQQHLAAQHSHHFPETALVPALKPEELDAKSLKAAARHVPAGESLMVGRLCLSCGASFTTLAKLEQHVASCSEKKDGEKKHACYFKPCKELLFKSLPDLVYHFEEEHSHLDGSERRMFPNSTLFGSWLTQEMQKCGVKFALAATKVKSGCSYSTYFCPHFNTQAGKESEEGSQCFARLHVKTRWCHAKFDYSGRTEVVYFKEHQHKTESQEDFSAIVEASKNLKVQFSSADRLTCKEDTKDKMEKSSEEKVEVVSEETPPAPVKTPKPSVNGLDRPSAKPEKSSDVKKPNPIPQRSSRTPVPKLHFSPDNYKSNSRLSSAAKISAQNNNNKKTGGAKRQREEESSEESANEEVAPKVAKRRPGRPINNNINSKKSKQKAGPPSKKAKKETSEETTYVLPANLDEWGKLFDMVRSQMNSGTLSNRSGTPEARNLLKHQHNITTLPLEQQVHVFNRLCSLANIQVD